MTNQVTVTGFIAAPSIEDAEQYMPTIDEDFADKIAFEQGWNVYTVEMTVDFSTLEETDIKYDLTNS